MVLESASVNNAHVPVRNKRMKGIDSLLRAGKTKFMKEVSVIDRLR